MDIVSWKRKGGEEHTIYTEDEARAAGVAYVHWKDVSESGYWGLTDDGYVTQLLACWSYTNKKGQITWLKKFSAGRIWQNRLSKFEWLPRKDHHAKIMSRTGWIERELRRSRTDRAVKVFASFIVAGKDPDWKSIGAAYRPDQEIPEATAKRLFKNPKVRAMVDRELIKILTGLDITQTYVLTHMKGVVERSLGKDDLTNARLQLQDLGKILEIFPKDTPRGFDMSRMIPTVEEYTQVEGYDTADEDAKMLQAAGRSVPELEKPPPEQGI